MLMRRWLAVGAEGGRLDRFVSTCRYVVVCVGRGDLDWFVSTR